MTHCQKSPADAGLRVFLTGASSGLGRAFAHYYAGQGARIGLVARRGDVLEALCAELPGEHVVLMADVGDVVAMRRAAERFLDEVGVPDIVIGNAGVSVGTLTECAEDHAAFEKLMRTNVLGMVATFQPFVGPMRERGCGRLVGVASVAGVRGLPGAGAYSASKAAVRTYLESLRVELHGSGVRVVTLAPGYVVTPMTAVNTYPMPFILQPDEAVRRMAKVIDAGRSYAVVPWQMGVVAGLLRLLPDWAFDRIFSRAGRKPRGLPL